MVRPCCERPGIRRCNSCKEAGISAIIPSGIILRKKLTLVIGQFKAGVEWGRGYMKIDV